MLFLFFKQKTAYEMRISDWSSDVCSSDLKAQSPDAELFGAENRGDDDVAPGLEPTVGAQPDAVAEAVERENLIDFGQAHFPRRAGIFDAGLGRGAGAASVARDEDDVGVRLGDPGSHRADARRADQLHADARLRIDLLQVVDELRQILDRIDVVVGRRADQRDAGRRVAQPRDELGDLEARKLAALAGLRSEEHTSELQSLMR